MDPEAAAARLAGEPVRTVRTVVAGRNSLIARVDCVSGRRYALKRHRRDDGDGRDRLGTEAAALTFLRARSVSCVPAVAAAADGWLLMEWIEGTAVGTVELRDIDDALAFARTLKGLAVKPDASALPLASEACLSSEALLAQIDVRLARLDQVTGEPGLAAFLGDFRSVLRTAQAALPAFTEISPTERTLSPSDFGFHNALRRPDGSLAYLDFEYFGWDDPVKLACDFLLHPGMSLPPALKRRFAAGMVEIFAENRQFLTRFQRLLPLYGLRWCMILLNEFVPGKGAAWEGGSPDAYERRKADQLDKAQRMLAVAMSDGEAFPYGA